MYTQEYIDNLPTFSVQEVALMKADKRRALKHFKSTLGCRTCGCLVRVVSNTNRGQAFCAMCSKSFKHCDVTLPVRKPTEATTIRKGLKETKRSPLTCAGQNATMAHHNRRVSQALKENWSIGVAFGGMNTI